MAKTLAEKIAVMQAAEAGKKIECLSRQSSDDKWFWLPNPLWNWQGFDYRVKPEYVQVGKEEMEKLQATIRVYHVASDHGLSEKVDAFRKAARDVANSLKTGDSS